MRDPAEQEALYTWCRSAVVAVGLRVLWSGQWDVTARELGTGGLLEDLVDVGELPLFGGVDAGRARRR